MQMENSDDMAVASTDDVANAEGTEEKDKFDEALKQFDQYKTDKLMTAQEFNQFLQQHSEAVKNLVAIGKEPDQNPQNNANRSIGRTLFDTYVYRDVYELVFGK